MNQPTRTVESKHKKMKKKLNWMKQQRKRKRRRNCKKSELTDKFMMDFDNI
jgi:hypothetical protein